MVLNLISSQTNFLRTYLPDVDVTAELIREQLSEEVALTRQLERFDPHAGNTLDAFRFQTNFPDSYLLFPSGETNCDLSERLLEGNVKLDY